MGKLIPCVNPLNMNSMFASFYPEPMGLILISLLIYTAVVTPLASVSNSNDIDILVILHQRNPMCETRI